MTAEPPPRTKKQAGDSARQMVAQVQAVSQQGDRLNATAKQLQEAARQQVAVLNQEQASTQLADTPVTELRKFTGKGLRLGKLEQAGYTTVGQIQQATHDELLASPGVGSQTVYEAKDAANRVADRIRADTRFRFDPDRRDPRQTRLLATLAAERSAKAASQALNEPLRHFAAQVQPLMPLARKAGSRWSMFWSGRRRKREVLSALAELGDLINNIATQSLVTSLQEALGRSNPSKYDLNRLWRQYESEAAAFNTALAQITGADAANAGELDDFISDELRQKIEAVPFDASLLRSTLRVYQLFGAKYTIHQERAILGDEMGLGKTIQALAVCAHLAAKGQQRFLVVCPTSVQANWIAEIKRHTILRSFSLHGPKREEQGLQWMRRGGVAVTTFNTLDRLEFLKRNSIEPALLVVDEAHFVKNPDAKRSKAVAELNRRAQRALFLTGTPMENQVEEFQNLISYLRPDVADRIEAGETIIGAGMFRRLVAPVYLRRNQEDVLTELPDKIEVEDWVQFNQDDYRAYHNEVAARNLMGMRRAASAMPGSVKLDRLTELVQQAGLENHKVIVFSYFLDVLEAVKKTLGDQAMGPITGKVPVQVRQELIDEFTASSEPSALLSQIEAGGVGLNIQAASVVIIAEPQWKPSTEEQAVARAHRMGQVRKVQVHRLLAKESVDERIREIQEDKLLLFEHYARRSDAKHSDGMAVDTGFARPTPLDDDSIPVHQRIVVAERIRLGMD